ncbi:MAG: helix-turn-helix domain-containing protein [Pyrinomonadaceae bacterium]
MQNLVFTQLSIPEVRQLFRQELEQFFSKQLNNQKTETDEIGGIDLAVEITGKAKPTIYGLVHDRKIPHSKRGKQLYFSRRELTEWIKDGKRKTQSEIALEAETFSTTNHKTTVATR